MVTLETANHVIIVPAIIKTFRETIRQDNATVTALIINVNEFLPKKLYKLRNLAYKKCKHRRNNFLAFKKSGEIRFSAYQYPCRSQLFFRALPLKQSERHMSDISFLSYLLV